MKKLTKLTALALALVMVLCLLAGCGSSNADSSTDNSGGDTAKTKLVVATSPDFPPFESLEGG